MRRRGICWKTISQRFKNNCNLGMAGASAFAPIVGGFLYSLIGGGTWIVLAVLGVLGFIFLFESREVIVANYLG